MLFVPGYPSHFGIVDSSLIGVNITAFGRKLTLFLEPSRFSLKNVLFFFAYFELEKMRPVRSAQRQVELRRLGNQLPVLNKVNSLCKIVKLCVLPVF